MGKERKKERKERKKERKKEKSPFFHSQIRTEILEKGQFSIAFYVIQLLSEESQSVSHEV